MTFDSRDAGLTRQRWFKPAVSAWFALLLGGGTLAIWLMTPPFRRDAALADSGLAGLHRYFEAPAGNAGMAVIVGVAALFGLLLGRVIAGRVIAGSKPLPFVPELEIHDDSDWSDEAIFGAREAVEPQRRRVFFAREDIGEDGITPTSPLESRSATRGFAEFAADERGVPVVAADHEPEVTETIDAPAETPPAQRAAHADLSLDQLTDRLKAALGGYRQRSAAPAMPKEAGDDDAVITFLRRETSRALPADGHEMQPEQPDSQAMLRGALDRLDRLGKSG